MPLNTELLFICTIPEAEDEDDEEEDVEEGKAVGVVPVAVVNVEEGAEEGTCAENDADYEKKKLEKKFKIRKRNDNYLAKEEFELDYQKRKKNVQKGKLFCTAAEKATSSDLALPLFPDMVDDAVV